MKRADPAGVAVTTPETERWQRFADAVRRKVPGGGELMTKTEEMLEVYGRMRDQEARQEGREQGCLEGQIGAIENLLRAAMRA